MNIYDLNFERGYFMASKQPIGVFDSGLGGLTVVKEIIRQMPNENIVYFGDTGRVPYGTRSYETIKRYAAEDEAFLLKQNVKVIIAACGTVSSVASEDAQKLPVPFFEVVSHAAAAAVKATKNGKIGVLGTAATVKSGSHAKKINELMPEAEVTACACSLFVPLVEEGWYSADDVIVTETVKRYLKPIIDAKCDTLILGCTHFPILTAAISKVLGEKVTLIDAGVATAAAVKAFLEENGLSNSNDEQATKAFYVSDRPDSFTSTAKTLLGEAICEDDIKQVKLNSL